MDGAERSNRVLQKMYVMKCLNKSLPLVQDLLKVIPNEGAVAILFDRLGENATYEQIVAENQRLTQETIRATPSIKPGVEELFQENPELANAVYEASGFNIQDNTIKDLTFELIDSDNQHDYFKIFYKGKDLTTDGKVTTGGITLSLHNQGYIDAIEIPTELRNKGLGKSIYRKVNLELLNGELKSDSLGRISEDAKRVWESLVKSGEAIKTTTGYKFKETQITPQQKQQAQQLYSQYLDTIFPESKVKDIVYHGTDKELKKFYDNLRSGIHFGTLKQAEGRRRVTDFEFKRNAKFISAIVDLKNPLKTKDFDWEKAGDAFTSWQPGDDLSDLDFTEYLISSGIIKEEEIQDAEGDFDLINKKGYDGVVYKNEGAGETTGENSYAVSKSEQIHILGNKQDIEGFKQFVSGAAPSAMFQLEEVPTSVASPETIGKVKKLLEKMGVSIKDLATYVKEAGLTNVKGVNGVADLTRRIIAIAEGKEDVALTEEMVHIATAILEQKNPQLVTQMISKIDRFAIYKRTLDEYKNNPAYQLPNGKPNIRKIKKEAVDKLISELIVLNNEGNTQFPELLEEENRSVVRNWWQKILDWFRGMYKAANIDIFQEVTAMVEEGVEGDLIDMDPSEIYYQLSDPQKALQKRILETKNIIRKKFSQEENKKVDPILMDTEEASNWYEVLLPDGTWSRITKRVTDRVKAWYKQRFPSKEFTEEEKRFNEAKRQLGVQGHAYLEDIHGRYFESDGTRKKNPSPRTIKLNTSDREVYQKLENYYTELIAKFSENGKNPLVFSEVTVYDPKEKEAGTIDLLIVEENGKTNIIDWKFMSVADGAKDVPWFKQGAYNIQLGRYKDILRERYGVKEIGMNRAIPIIMSLKYAKPKDKTSKILLQGIAIGSVDTSKIEDLKLVPVSEETETTGFENLDELIKDLNSIYKQIQKQEVTDETEYEFKKDRLNIIKEAIRIAQGTGNIAPLVDVIETMRKEGQQILDDYTTTYEGRPANSKGEDFTDKKLSDFAASMREYTAMADVFGAIPDLIGDLIYNEKMEKEATSDEAKEDVENRKKLLSDITEEASKIRKSSKEIKKISGKFADKFIGERNLITGLLDPEVLVKGLSSLFRGVSELPMASLRVLTTIVNNARGKASRDAIGEIDRLMTIRKKLVDRGGDVRKLVQQIYQKDDKNKLVNKMIYKFEKAFFEGVDNNALEGARDKKWLMENIDVEAYKKDAKELLDKKIARFEKLYGDKPDLMDELIIQEKRKWDITRSDFTGWNNYIIRRHPLPKWKSEQYKQIEKDPDLLELYNFISEINQKATDSGYISNKVTSTFFPFVRKSMAESFAWDFSLSAITNFGDNLSVRADDVGLGKINELNGELENGIPKYYTYDFTRGEDGVNDYSDVSEDLFKNMILYINHMEKYKYLSAVEDQLLLVKTIETFKGHLKTNNVAEVVFDENNKPVVLSEGKADSQNNAKIFDDFLRAVLYEQKYPLSDTDTPLGIGKVKNFIKKSINNVTGREVFTAEENPSATSLIKAMDATNRYFQLKTLGLEFISGAVNTFGTNIQIAAQAGNYFKGREVLSNEMKLVGNKFKNDEEREMFVQLIDTFLPLKDDPTYERLQKAGLTFLTRQNFSDMLMVFMREPEQHIEKSIFLTLLDNSMVENGRIVNINEFVKKKYKDRYTSPAAYREAASKMEQEIAELKKTRSISAIKKLQNGKLVIPGLDLSNADELQRLTNLTRRISRNATGNLSADDINRMGLNVWTRSIMVFRNWIPKLVDTRFGEFRKVADDFSVEIGDDGLTTGEKYDIGRIRLFAYVLGTSIRDRSTNLINILSVNEKGLALLDKMYEEFAENYRKRNGKELQMDREQFIDLVRTNLRNQMKELAILFSLFGAALSLGMFAPDDDDDRADKNFYRYAQRVVGRFTDELLFFYNPAEFQKILSGSIFPATSIFSDAGRFVSHFLMETTGMDISDPELTEEQVRKKAQPIKNLGKMFPLFKSLFTYGSMIDAEFAKEFDITIQKESRR